MGSRKSASDLAGELAGLGDDIERLARDETRVHLGRHLEEMFVGGPKVGRGQFGHRSPWECVEDMLQEAPLRELDGLAEFVAKLEEDGATEDFTAGILFAARLMQDTTFDF
ncbi:hypothetical protein ACFV24_32900 [Nocardia fluminea]|uniref:hypothetical protein n=1 Tax=Nocardia fluminea TaxID=134984 RepID=UPI00366AE26E